MEEEEEGCQVIKSASEKTKKKIGARCKDVSNKSKKILIPKNVSKHGFLNLEAGWGAGPNITYWKDGGKIMGAQE